ERHFLKEEGTGVSLPVKSRRIKEQNNPFEIPGNIADLENEYEVFRQVFENSKEAMLLTDSDGTVMACNAAASKLFGYTKEEICGLGRQGLADMSDSQWNRGLAQKKKPGRFSGILRYKKKDGSTFYGETSSIVFKTRKGIKRTSTTITDITKQKELEVALKYSEEKFRLLVEELPLFIWSADENGNIDFLSGEWKDFNSTIMDNGRGLNWAPAVHLEDLQRTTEAWKRSILTGEDFIITHRLLKNDGRFTWRLTRSKAIKDSWGRVIRWYGTSTAIDDQKKLENDLRESEERFRIAQEASPDGFIIFKPIFDDKGDVADFIFEYENSAAGKMAGHDPGDVTGRRMLEVFPGQKDSKFFNTYKQVFKSKEPVTFEEFYRGETIYEGKWFRILVIPTKGGIAIVAQDITKKKELELMLARERELFEGIFNSIPVMITLFDPNLKTFKLNNELKNVLGYTDEDALDGRLMEKAYPDPEQRKIVADFMQSLEKGWREFRITAKNGSTIDTSWANIRLSDDTMIGIGIDIREKKKADRSIQRTLSELERSNRELEQFAYAASHDLQEPLRMISNYAQMLARKYKERLDENADIYIGFITDGAKRMNNLIQDLLLYARITSKQEQFTQCNLNHIVSEVIRDLQMIINESSAGFEIDELPEVSAIPALMKQLFQNLIQNALKFRGDEKPVIKISAKNKAGQWIISVKDNGIGIDKDFYNKIFLLFQRLNDNVKYPGTGIGLSLCKKIVELHGGSIWVESEINKGSEFFFTLSARI
ncbi:MAG: PAS domain S-box protein, partial [Syntrophothermus sp.]